MTRPYAATGSFPFVNHRTVAELNCDCGQALPASNTTGKCQLCGVRAHHAARRLTAPADFADHAHLGNSQLADHYEVSTTTIYRWRKATGNVLRRHGRPPGNKRPIPAEFADVAPRMTNSELCARFGVQRETIAKWARIVGVRLLVIRTPSRLSGTVMSAPLTNSNRDSSLAGRAADFLQRFGPVYRCDATGAPKPNGTHWRRGNSDPLTADEIIERAVAKGFDPDAWKRLAA